MYNSMFIKLINIQLINNKILYQYYESFWGIQFFMDKKCTNTDIRTALYIS